MSYFAVFDTLTYLTVAGQVLSIVIGLAVVLSLMGNRLGLRMRSLVSKHALILMFVVALVATSGSLFFSEIALFAPCKDCWFQRIFMYPQVILLAVALWRKDRTIAWYILALCIVGGALSLDHYSDQWEAILNPIEHDPLAPCDLSGVSCSATYIFELGYITIPLMAATAFLLNALGSITVVLSTNAKKK